MTTSERQARMLKANKLAAAIRLLAGSTYGPDLPRAVAGMDERGWQAAAKLAGTHVPHSDHTRRLVAGIIGRRTK